MVRNRLRDFRKKDLGISSVEKFAELLGGEAAGWYHQRVQRIETGQTALTDEVAWEIADKFKVPVYTLLVDPKVILDEFDTELASRYKDAPDHVQKTIKDLLGMK